MKPPKTAERGFTLPELLVTLVVAAVLAGLAGPSLVQFIRAARLSTTANQLEADLQLARREAIKRNTRVLVCPVGTTAGQCGSSFTASAWAAGWHVCYDTDFNGQCDIGVTTNPNPIRTRGRIDSSLAMTAPGAVARFNADGSQGAGTSTLTFTVAGSWSGSKMYTSTIAGTGNISLAKTS